jgi:hypothetical protein
MQLAKTTMEKSREEKKKKAVQNLFYFLPRGKFQGEMMRTTPSGSGTIAADVGNASSGVDTCATENQQQTSSSSCSIYTDTDTDIDK